MGAGQHVRCPADPGSCLALRGSPGPLLQVVGDALIGIGFLCADSEGVGEAVYKATL